GDGDGHTGQVDALVVGDRSGHLHFGDHVGLGDFHGPQPDLAVVDQQGVADSHITGQALECGGAALPGAFDLFGGDGEAVADGQLVGPVGEAAEPDLGALQVGEDGYCSAQVLGHFANGAVGLL